MALPSVAINAAESCKILHIFQGFAVNCNKLCSVAVTRLPCDLSERILHNHDIKLMQG